MGFYDSNPGAKTAFAQAGAIHDGSAPGAVPGPIASDPGAGAPTNDPVYKAVAAGVPDGELNLMFNPANTAQPGSGTPTPAGMPTGLAGLSPGYGGMMPSYEDGGLVEDQDDGLNAALAAVKSAFDFGMQKHGVGGQQQASAIPVSPGTQSTQGGPKPLPMPGPLPPTANPFGKRNNPYPAGGGQQMSEAEPDQEPDNDSDDETA